VREGSRFWHCAATVSRLSSREEAVSQIQQNDHNVPEQDAVYIRHPKKIPASKDDKQGFL